MLHNVISETFVVEVVLVDFEAWVSASVWKLSNKLWVLTKIELNSWVLEELFVVLKSSILLNILVVEITWVLLIIISNCDSWVLIGIVSNENSFVCVGLVSNLDSFIGWSCNSYLNASILQILKELKSWNNVSFDSYGGR